MKEVVIIAEAGVNHNGNLEMAKKLIDAAALAKADYVKFQTFISEDIVDASAKKANYQKDNVGGGDSQLEMIKKLELKIEDFDVLNEYCKKRNIKFLTTAADLVSLEKITKYNLDFYKISSGEIINKQYLEIIASLGKPVVLSTGMSTLGEIERALNILIENGLTREFITVLHCNTEYPTPMEDVNLRAMNTIQQSFNVKVGYSDHTLGIEIPIAAVALGAKVIEKHFTLDKTLPGPDHRASLEPEELSAMVKGIRNIEKALSGSGLKEPSDSEKKNKIIVRKSIFLKNNMKTGDIITKKDLIMKRPGDGISAIDIDLVVDRELNLDVKAGEKLQLKHVKW